MGKFEILDHTADLAMKITGDDPVDFFTQALNGLNALEELDEAVLGEQSSYEDLDITGNDLEEILVRFLNELIRLIQESEMAPVEIQDANIEPQKLLCKILVKPILEYPEGYVEIKAATYHMLKVENISGNLIATVILDI